MKKGATYSQENSCFCRSSVPEIIPSFGRFILLMATGTDRVTGRHRACHPAALQETDEWNTFIPWLSV